MINKIKKPTSNHFFEYLKMEFNQSNFTNLDSTRLYDNRVILIFIPCVGNF